jgi:hypothetical protein
MIPLIIPASRYCAGPIVSDVNRYKNSKGEVALKAIRKVMLVNLEGEHSDVVGEQKA